MKQDRIVVAIGNTNTKAALLRGLELQGQQIIIETVKLSKERLQRALEELSIDPNTTTVLSSVVPTASALLCDALQECGVAPAIEVDASRVDWMRVEYEPRNTLGADRLSCVLGVRELYGGPAIVVDFGTATTVNVLDDQGNFAGGTISPGITTSFRALYGETAQLPLLDAKKWTRPPAIFGRNTTDAIAAGVFWSAWYAVCGMVAEAKKGFRGKPRIVLTGGAAPLFAVLADDGWISDEYILLKGAASFAMRTGTDG